MALSIVTDQLAVAGRDDRNPGVAFAYAIVSTTAPIVGATIVRKSATDTVTADEASRPDLANFGINPAVTDRIAITQVVA